MTAPLQPPSVSPAPAPRPKGRALRLVGLGCLGLLALACGLIALVGWQESNRQARLYAAGHAAYTAADCETAIDNYDRLLARDSDGELDSQVERDADFERGVCQAYLAVVALEQDGHAPEALLGYSQFVTDLASTPLAEAARSRAAGLFTQVEAAALVDTQVCQQLDELRAQELMPEPEANLPALFLACGEVYEAQPDYGLALYFYDRFRTEYPDHPLADEVENAYVRTVLAEAQATGAGDLPQPQTVGGTGAGPAVVVIRNDSPEKMSLVFSGPVVRVEELAACAECETFTGTGPDECPEQGPVGEYTLAPGTYDVVVRSISDFSVTPFRGEWEINSGEEYASCFYLVHAAP